MIAYTYDAMGNLVSQTTTGAYDLALEYAYDRSGRMTKESRTENGATLESGYVYDALGQLTAFERSDNISESYTYDPVGNMLSKTQNGVKTRYTYNAANQLISDGENRYVYDKNGNLVQKGNTKYTYNALNLLQSWTDGEHSETYTYNANGLLSTIQNNEGTINLTWDILMGDGVVISAQNGESTTTYTYGLERISAQTGNRKTEYIYDGRGSVAAEVSYNNAWYTLGGVLSKKDVVSKSYTPFGEQIGEATSGFGYNGEYYNAATGQIYLRARFYEPEMNRFSQKDIVRGSITSPGSLNRYSYVQNDPINFIDPSGHSLKSAWNMVKSSVTNTVKNIVSNPVQAVKSAAKAVVNAVTHPVKTVTNAAKSVGNAVRTVYNEVRTPDSQSKYTSPATSRGTGSAYSGSSSASSGGGAYASPLSTSGSYTSSGVATSYYNSSYQTGKLPSPDAPSIKDVAAEDVYYCSQKPSNNTELPWYKRAVNQADAIFSNVKSWVTSEQGQKTLMIAGSVIEIGAGIAITVATGGTGGVLLAAASSALVGGGASSAISGYITEALGGDFKTGWVGGQISGSITGAGIGAGSLGFSSVALDIGASAKQFFGGTTILVGSSGLAGFTGGTLSSIYTQWSSDQELDVNAALKNGITSGSISALSWPFSAVSSALGSADASITSTIVSLIEEGIFDVSGGYVGAAAEVTK